jgi:hypothetical protein
VPIRALQSGVTIEPVSATTVAAYARRRQRVTLGGLVAMAPVAAVVVVLGIATFTLSNPLGVIPLVWPIAMMGRVAAQLLEEYGRLRRARELLADPEVTCLVRSRMVWISAGGDQVGLRLEHSGVLRGALPEARVLSRGRP